MIGQFLPTVIIFFKNSVGGIFLEVIFYPGLSDLIDMEGAEPVVDTEEHLLAVLSVSVEQDLVPDCSVETPEDPVPGLQPVGRVRKVQLILLGLREVDRFVTVARHLETASYLIINIEI